MWAIVDDIGLLAIETNRISVSGWPMLTLKTVAATAISKRQLPNNVFDGR